MATLRRFSPRSLCASLSEFLRCSPYPSPGTPPTALSRGTLLLVVLAAVAVVPLPAQAAPAVQAQTAGDAAALMAARAHELEQVTERFNAARDHLAAEQAAAQAAAATVQQKQAALAAAQVQVRGIARSAYTTGGLSSFQALLTSGSADDFVRRESTLQTIAGHQNDVVGRAVEAGLAAGRAQAGAEAEVARAKATYATVAAQQADLQKQVNAYQADFDRLTAQEKQAAVAAAETHGAPAAALAEADRASRSGQRAAPVPSAPVVANNQAAQIALNTAMGKLGTPYVWAAAGPGSFDCSGLTQFAYRAAGIDLPHSAEAQAGMGRAVSRSQLQPGDLVFFYSPISHVGIYLGNNQMVHAPTSGDVVKVTNIDYMGGITALRRLAG